MSSIIMLEDMFKVDEMNPDGKKFDKVSRIVAKNDSLDLYMELDVNTDIYPVHVGDKYALVLANTLNKDGTPDTGYYTQTTYYPIKCKSDDGILTLPKPTKCDSQFTHGLLFNAAGRKSLADDYEYVMHGKLYKIAEEKKQQTVKTDIYVSFGGLLMLLRGEPSTFANFELDQRLFLLMRKV